MQIYICIYYFPAYHDDEQQQQQQRRKSDRRVFVFFFFLFFFFDLFLRVFSRLLISRTISAKVSLTLMASFADVSTYGHVHARARASASSGVTCRCSEASHLLPTRQMGTFSVPFTRRICSRTVRASRNDCHEVRLKTTRKPRPFLMYRSRMDANCSVPKRNDVSAPADKRGQRQTSSVQDFQVGRLAIDLDLLAIEVLQERRTVSAARNLSSFLSALTTNPSARCCFYMHFIKKGYDISNSTCKHVFLGNDINQRNAVCSIELCAWDLVERRIF